MNKKPFTLLNVVLAIGLIVVSFFVGGSITGGVGSANQYDPWCDVNDDGKINMKDIGELCLRYGTEGTPIPKAGLLFDSGWVNITDKAGQYIPLIHNQSILNLDHNTSVIFDITGKTTLSGPILRHQGLQYIPYHLEWESKYGGADDDVAYAMIQTNDKGFALAGYTSNGDDDLLLVKTDANGYMQWNKMYGGAHDDSGQHLIQTCDGGYAIAGYTESYGAGGKDFWLVKTDENGTVQWNQTYGGSDDDKAEVVVQACDGGYALAGYTCSFGAGDHDFWLVKTDSNGNMEWNKSYGGALLEQLYHMIKTYDGGYLLVGETRTYGHPPSDDYWLVKTNSTGEMEWSRAYGGNGEDDAKAAVQTSDGGYVISGGSGSFGDPDGDVWLIRINSTGDTIWNRTYGGSDYESGENIIETCDGGFAVSGITKSYGAGDRDFWLLKVDAFGNPHWNETYGGTAEDTAMADMAQTCEGGYVIGGFSRTGGNYDFWLVKIGVESGLAWTDSTADTITLYRGATDPYWNYVRVRIWKIKEPDP